MIKIDKIEIRDYEYLKATNINVDFDGRINVNEFIPELIELIKKWENKDANN